MDVFSDLVMVDPVVLKEPVASLEAKMGPSSPSLNSISQESSVDSWIYEHHHHFQSKFNFEKKINNKWMYNWLVVGLTEWDQTEKLKYGIDLQAWRTTATANNNVLRIRQKLADLQTKMVIPDKFGF